MKKWHSFLAVLALFTPSTYAHPCNPCDVYLPVFRGHVDFLLSTIITKASLFNLDFAQTSALDPTDRTLQTLRPSYGYGGYELGIGYEFNCTANDVKLHYLHNMQDADNRSLEGDLVSTITLVRQPITNFSDVLIIQSAGVPVGVTVATGSLLDLTNLDEIRAHISTSQDVVDLEGGQTLHITPDFRVRFFGGLRSSKLNNDYTTTLSLSSRDNATSILSSPLVTEAVNFINRSIAYKNEIVKESNFTGLGPRFGVEANYNIAIGFSFFGSVSSAILVGDITRKTSQDTEFRFFGEVAGITLVPLVPDLTFIPTLAVGDIVNVDNEVLQHWRTPDDVRIVPNAEARLGISYCFCLPCSRSHALIEGGYLVNHYWNAVEWVTTNTTFFQHNKEIQDVTYDGIYLALKVHV